VQVFHSIYPARISLTSNHLVLILY